MIASLLVAQTIVPMLTRAHAPRRPAIGARFMLGRLQRSLRRVRCGWTLAHPWKTAAGIVLILASRGRLP